VGGRHRDDHARFADRYRTDAMRRGGGDQPVGRDQIGKDGAHLLVRHLRVGLVVQHVDVARLTLECDDRPRTGVANQPHQPVERQRLVGDRHVDALPRPAAHGWNQRHLVAIAKRRVVVGIDAVDRDRHAHLREQLADADGGGRTGGGGPGSGGVGVGQLNRGDTGLLAQHCKESNGHCHRRTLPNFAV
jgi:hypothetical protein